MNNIKIVKKLKLIIKNKKHIYTLISFILIITFIFFTIKKIKNTPHIPSNPSFSNHQDIYTHQSNKVMINIYNINKKTLSFELTAQHIQYCPNQKITHFIQPNITIFNAKNTAIWNITSNRAVLNHKKNILHLQKCIYINNLLKNIYFSSILTNQLKINLITNDILSNTTVILQGYYFYSIGTQMQGNLYTQIIQFIKKTHTYYEIQYITQ